MASADEPKFSIGYNHDLALLDLLEAQRSRVEALYFPIPRACMGSGRRLPQPPGYAEEILELIDACRKLGIKSQALLNATCVGSEGLEARHFARVADTLEGLFARGLDTLIVANPIYIVALRTRFPEATIESSVNCYVKTVEQALYLKELGVDVITIDRDINRDLVSIRRIKEATGLPLRVLLTEGCLRNCPFRQAHFNSIAHHAPAAGTEILGAPRPDRWGQQLFERRPGRILQVGFIPPDALHHYRGVADRFKISGRGIQTFQIERRLRAYALGRFEGNLLELLDSACIHLFYRHVDYATLARAGFFERLLACADDCQACTFCDDLIAEAATFHASSGGP